VPQPALVPTSAAPAEDGGRWLTLAEVAARTGRHIDAVRSWAQRARRAERVRTQKNNCHEPQVWLTPELEAELAQGVASAASADASAAGEGAAELVAELRSRIDDLTEAVAEARIGQARVEGELAAELRRSTDLAAALDKAEAQIGRLEAELREMRRPWLAKVIEGLRRKG
jgi:chemotaxis protein histidine kinase CheA